MFSNMYFKKTIRFKCRERFLPKDFGVGEKVSVNVHKLINYIRVWSKVIWCPKLICISIYAAISASYKHLRYISTVIYLSVNYSLQISKNSAWYNIILFQTFYICFEDYPTKQFYIDLMIFVIITKEFYLKVKHVQ